MEAQSWDGLEIVHDLPNRGRGVNVTRSFCLNEVVCDYGGTLLAYKDGKEIYEATEDQKRYVSLQISRHSHVAGRHCRSAGSWSPN